MIDRQEALKFVVAISDILEASCGGGWNGGSWNPEREFWHEVHTNAMIAYEVVYEGRDPADTTLPRCVAARFLGRIANKAELLKSQFACGYGTREEVKFWTARFIDADVAYDEIYEQDMEKPEQGPEPLVWRPLEEDDHVLTRRAFEEAVKDGAFIDYDGYGLYADRKRKRKSNVTVWPSLLAQFGWNDMFTHVVWYNR